MGAVRLKSWYYRQLDADHTQEVPGEGYGGWKQAELPLDLGITASLEGEPGLRHGLRPRRPRPRSRREGSMRRKWATAFLLLLALPAAGAAETLPRAMSLGLSGGLNVAYHGIQSAALDSMEGYGLGSLGLSGALVSLYAGVHLYASPYVLASVVFSAAGAGGYTWENLLGLADDFAVYVQVFDLLGEVHLMYPLIPWIYPFVGAGYTVASSIDDDAGSGFMRGRGLVLTAGLDLAILKAFSLVSERALFCPRIGVIYRPTFRYGGFYLERVLQGDADAFVSSLRAQGSTATPNAADFFRQAMDASAFSIYAGLHLSVPLTKRPATPAP
jgi:hypothetical protein